MLELRMVCLVGWTVITTDCNRVFVWRRTHGLQPIHSKNLQNHDKPDY